MPLRNITTDFKTALTNPSGRLKTAQPYQLFADRHTYNVGSTLWETVDNTNGTVSHLPDESGVSMSIPGASGDKLTRQSYEQFLYTPSRPLKFEFACLFPSEDADLRARVGAFTAENGFFLEKEGTTLNIVRRTHTSGSTVDNEVAQASWNSDTLDGTGPSGKTLDLTKIQMIFIEYLWYGAGVIRVGFDIEGENIIAHEFAIANTIAAPSATTGTLPLRYEIENTGATGTTSVLKTYGASVVSEGGNEVDRGFTFNAEGTVTAASGTRTHLLSVRPKTTFNSVENRILWELENLEMLVTGANPVKWELGYGHTLTTPSWTDVDATYSAFEYDTSGTIDSGPTMVVTGGYTPDGDKSAQSVRANVKSILPLTLDAAGATRDLGTIGLFVTGIGGTSDCRGIMNWRETI